MAQVCLLPLLRLVFLVFQYFIVQLLVCFAIEVSQNIRNGFIIVLVNNELVFCVFIQHFSFSKDTINCPEKAMKTSHFNHVL